MHATKKEVNALTNSTEDLMKMVKGFTGGLLKKQRQVKNGVSLLMMKSGIVLIGLGKSNSNMGLYLNGYSHIQNMDGHTILLFHLA